MLIDLEDFFKYTKLDIKRKSKVLLSFKETEKGTPKKGNERYSISPLDPILITPLYMQFCLGRIMHNTAFCLVTISFGQNVYFTHCNWPNLSIEIYAKPNFILKIWF